MASPDEPAGAGGEPVLSVRGLTKAYDQTTVVEDVAFDLYPGEVLTLLGPSGCGKSTTLRMIAGLEAPDRGEVWVHGRLVASAERRVMVAPEGRNIGLVFQSYAVWPHMTVEENIAYPLRVRRHDRDEVARRVEEIVRLVRLDGLAQRMSTELSGGQQQRVALARALVYEPALVLLDEPLSNLDTVLRKEMRAQLKSLQARLGTAFLYVTHDQAEAMSLSRRVAVMNRGRIEQIGTPESVYERPASRFVQSFVGETIRMAGVVDGGPAGPRIAIGESVIEAAFDGEAPPRQGSRVEVTLRPEDVVLAVAPTAGANGVAGSILDTTYYGDRVECAVRIEAPGDQVVVVGLAKDGGLAVGDRVFLGFDRTRVRVWPL